MLRENGGGGAGCPFGLCSDGTGTLRDYWAARHQGTTIFALSHDQLIGAPEGVPRSPALQVANAIQPGFVLILGRAIGDIAAWNAFVLLGFALTATAMFALLDGIGLSPAASAFGAYVFAFSPFAFEKALAGQVAFVHAWVFPLLVTMLIAVRARHEARRAVAAGVVVGVAFYVHTYLGFMALFLLALFFALDLASAGGAARRTLRDVAITLAAAIVSLAPALVVGATQHGGVASAVSRPVSDLQRLGARPAAYLLPSARNPIVGRVVKEIWNPLSSGEPSVFYGYSTIVLALVALVAARKRFSRPWDDRIFALLFGAVVAVVAWFTSLPRLLHLGPIPIPTTSFFVGSIFTAIRAYGRFGVLAGFGLAIAGAFGADLVRRRLGRSAALLLVPVAALELAAAPPLPTFAAARPPAYAQWLAAHPGGIVATYPIPSVDAPAIRLAERDYYNQRFHGHPLYTLWAGHVGGTREDAIRILSNDPQDPLTPSILAAEHVRYVVVHRDVYRALDKPIPVLASTWYTLAASEGNVWIYRLHAAPANLARVLDGSRLRVAIARGLPQLPVEFKDGFFPPERYHDGRFWRWMNQNGSLEFDNPEAGGLFQLNAIAFSADVPRHVDLVDSHGQVLGAADVTTSETQLDLGPFHLPKGHIRLQLHVSPDPAPFSATDPRVASIFVSPALVQSLATYSRSLRSR